MVRTAQKAREVKTGRAPMPAPPSLQHAMWHQRFFSCRVLPKVLQEESFQILPFVSSINGFKPFYYVTSQLFCAGFFRIFLNTASASHGGQNNRPERNALRRRRRCCIFCI